MSTHSSKFLDESLEIQSQIDLFENVILFDDSVCERLNILLDRCTTFAVIQSIKVVTEEYDIDDHRVFYILKVVADDTSESYDLLRVKDVMSILPPEVREYIGPSHVDIEYV